MTSKAMAFMRSGRFSVTTATWGWGLVISVKDMRGIVERAVMPWPEGPVAGEVTDCDAWRYVPCGWGGAAPAAVRSLRAIHRSRAARASQS